MPRIILDKRSIVALTGFPFVAMALLNGLYLESLYGSSMVWFWIVDGIQFLLIPGLAAYFLFKAASIRPCDYGFRSLGHGRGLFGIIGLIVFICAVFWITYVPVIWIAYRFLWPYAATFGYGMLIPESILPRLGAVIYLSGTAALVEEAVFRGLPWLYFSLIRPNRQPVAVYVLLSSFLFSAIHCEQGPHGMIAAFFLGVATAIFYVRIQNIWPFVVGHFIMDVISFW